MMSLMVPLSSVCPYWTGSLISSAVESLKRGIEIERERFRGKPFVVLLRRREVDYDGLTEYVELLEGFPTECEAVRDAQNRAEAARQAVLAEPCYGEHHWKLVDGPWPALMEDRPDRKPVRRLFHERFKLENGSGHDWRHFEFDVLHVGRVEVIGPELFAYLGSEGEVTRYFINRANKCRPDAKPGTAVGLNDA